MIDITHFMRHPHPGIFSIERVSEDIRTALPADCCVKTWTCRYPSTGLWPRLRDAWAARAAQGDVNHVTGDTHYLTWFLDRKKTILTIHDLVSLQRLRGFKRWLLWALWYWLPIKRSSKVVTISEATRQALLACVRCDPGKVVAILNPVSTEFKPAPKEFDANCPRILHIGTTPNKNIERVAQALDGASCELIIIGILSQEQISSLDSHAIKYQCRSDLSRQELLDEYRNADMLLFVSTYEGFGLPIVEANAVGRPVVTSQISSMPEVAADAACLVDPYDVASIRHGVLRVIENAAYRNELIQRGYVNAMRFSQEVVVARYAEVYRDVASASRRQNQDGIN